VWITSMIVFLYVQEIPLTWHRQSAALSGSYRDKPAE